MCVGVRGWEWEPLRFVGNLSAPSDLSWTEYKELGKQLCRRLFVKRGVWIWGTRVGEGNTSGLGLSGSGVEGRRL